MYSRHNRRARFLFALADALITVIAFEAAYQTRLWLPFEREFFIVVPTKALLLGASVLAWILLGYWLDTYDRLEAASPISVLRDTAQQCFFGFIAVLILEFILRLDLSRLFLVLFIGYSFALLTLFRWRAGWLLGWISREFAGPHYVMVVGLSDRALRMARLLEQSGRHGVQLLGFLNDSGEGGPGSVQLDRAYPVHAVGELGAILRERVVDEVIFAVDSQRLAELEETFLLCDEVGVRTRVAVDFFPHVNSDVYLDRLGPAPLLTFSAAPHDEIRLMIKRATDIVLALIGLLLLAPFMAIVAMLIRATSPGPAIFRQERCGLNGRRFTFYKFRSMCDNAEGMKAGLAHMNVKTTAFKIPDDPRLTSIGRYMRKFSVDEWPQLWNVVRGDMSLVGPRPAVPEEVENYRQWQRRRLRMRPGLTCLWAISGRDRLDFDSWMRLDMQYIDHWSLALDWKIILRTIPNVLLGKGAH